MNTDFLVDSGSTYTIIDYELYKALPKQNVSKLEELDLILKSANGESLKVHGQVSLKLTVGTKECIFPVKVVALGDRSTILGLDFMEEFDCVLYMGKGTLRMGKHHVVLHRKGDTRCARIQVAQNMYIPPHSEMIISGHVKPNQWAPERKFGLVEPTASVTENTGVLVAKSLVSMSNKDIPVRLANFTDETIKLRRGSTIGIVHPVNSVSNFDKGEHLAGVYKVTESNTASKSAKKSKVPEHLQSMVDLAAENLTKPELEKFSQLITKYQDVFTGADGRVGRTHLVEHSIDTGDARPTKQKHRRLPLAQVEKVDKELDRLEAEGLIETSNSPWSANLVVVSKKSGEIRICQDFRQLNEVTRKNAIGLPNIEECLTALSESTYYHSMDLAAGYNQIPMRASDRCKTAFYSPRRGLMQYTVMPFGLTGAPGTFMQLMETVLRGLQWEICVIYLDDILSFGRSFSQSIENLEAIFLRFRKSGLTLKPNKCKFFQTSVEFLGHLVSASGIACDPKKLEAVKDWPRPSNLTEVRQFVGFAAYYRRFVKSFSLICAPLYDLTKKNAPFIWTEQCESAFVELKKRLTESPVLAYPSTDKDRVFIVDTDASLYGVGGCLSQIGEDGEEHVIAYASKSLSATQRNYCTTMRELLAAVVFIKQFHHYLWGRNFILRTDHASLKWLVNFKEPEGMLARWLSVLSNYDYTVEHRKGTAHVNADGLSRQSKRVCKRDDCDDCALKRSDCVCVLRGEQASMAGRVIKGPRVVPEDTECPGTEASTQVNNCEEVMGVPRPVYHKLNTIRQQPSPSTLSAADKGIVPKTTGSPRPSKCECAQADCGACGFWKWCDRVCAVTRRQASKARQAAERQVGGSEGTGGLDTRRATPSVNSGGTRDIPTTPNKTPSSKEATVHEPSKNSSPNCEDQGPKPNNRVSPKHDSTDSDSVPRAHTTDPTLTAGSAKSHVKGNLTDCNWLEVTSTEQLRNHQAQDSDISFVISLKSRFRERPPNTELESQSSQVKMLCSQWNALSVRDGILYREWVPDNPRLKPCFQYVAPVKLRSELFEQVHQKRTAGHLGVTRTLLKLRRMFYWPGYKGDIARWCRHCKVCESYKAGHNPKRAPLQQRFVGTVLDKIALDVIGPIRESARGHNYILVVSDYYSKFVDAYPIPDQTAQTVADILVTRWICIFGCPLSIHSDQGRNFESDLFREICRLLDIEKSRTARYRPQSDGLVERCNRTLRQMLRSVVDEYGTDWCEHIPYVLMAYRSTVHETTKCTPNLLMFNREARLPVDLMYGQIPTHEGPSSGVCPIEYVEWVKNAMAYAYATVQQNVQKSAERQARNYNVTAKLRTFKAGQWVWVFYPPKLRDKFGRGWVGPYLVIQKLGTVDYLVQKEPGSKPITVHLDHIKEYSHDDVPPNWIGSDSPCEIATQTDPDPPL